MERGRKPGQHRALTLAEDLAGIGAWTWPASELNIGKIVKTNKATGSGTLEYEHSNERQFRTLKQIHFDAHVQREHGRPKMSLLRQYLLETKPENLSAQERIMRTAQEPDLAAANASRSISGSIS